MTKRSTLKPRFYYDPALLITCALLISLGLVMVGSASMVISDRQYGFAFHYLSRQFIYVGLGVMLSWFSTRVPLRIWQKYSRFLFFSSLLLLLLVLIPGVGLVINGARRWVHLGPMTLQVSEFVKLTSVLYLSSYLSRFKIQVREQLSGFLRPMLVLSVIAILLLLEPDFGATTVITVTFLGLLFLAGARVWPFVLIFSCVLLAMALLVLLSPYRLLRLTTFLSPWRHAFGSGYQLTQSLIAFGRGGVWGVGLGNSVQKMFYLPEAHSDFVFAVIAEELGLIGVLVLIGLFVALALRIVMLARTAGFKEHLYAQYLCYGIFLWFSSQALINMGVNAGMLPTKGLTLPFISYGGSSMLVTCLAAGLLLRVSYEVSCGAYAKSGMQGYSTYSKGG